MKNLVYISSLADNADTENVFYSLAGQVYQQKMIKAFPFKKVFSFNIHRRNTISVKADGNVQYFQYPASKFLRYFYILKFIRSINSKIERKDVLLMYNVYHRTLPIFLYFKFIRRIKIYVLLADYGDPKKSISNSLFHYILTRSAGLFSLSPNIKIHKNTVVQELLVQSGTAKQTSKEGAVNNNNILFSGTISKDTGILVAIGAMKYLPDFTLYISGSVFGISESEILTLIQGQSNIKFLGKLPTDRYNCLLFDCDICLSLRDPGNKDHQYNFPSKIGEFLSHKKTVISSLQYPGFEEFVQQTDWNVSGLVACIKNIQPKKDATEWLEKNFGLEKFNQNMNKLVGSSF